jgi:hypothetical protein
MEDQEDYSDGLSEFEDPVDEKEASVKNTDYEEFERVVKEAETEEMEEEEFEYSITGSIKESILEFYDIDVTGDIIGECVFLLLRFVIRAFV